MSLIVKSLNSSIRLLILGLFSIFCDQACAQTLSLWDHNGSIVNLEASNDIRRFFYFQPKANLPAKSGDLLFEGRRRGFEYEGTAYLFSEKCGKIGYPVKGSVSKDQLAVTLEGKAPRRDSSCNVKSYFDDKLTFRFSKTIAKDNKSENQSKSGSNKSINNSIVTSDTSSSSTSIQNEIEENFALIESKNVEKFEYWKKQRVKTGTEYFVSNASGDSFKFLCADLNKSEISGFYILIDGKRNESKELVEFNYLGRTDIMSVNDFGIIESDIHTIKLIRLLRKAHTIKVIFNDGRAAQFIIKGFDLALPTADNCKYGDFVGD